MTYSIIHNIFNLNRLGVTNYFPTIFRSKAIIKVKTADPIIAHTMGNGFPSIVIAKKPGRSILAAIQTPIYAPIYPTTIETRQPPKLYPAIDCPMPPQIAAINKSKRNPKSVIA